MDEMEMLCKRIKKLIIDNNTTQAEIAKSVLGYSDGSSLSRKLDPENTAQLTAKEVLLLAKHFGVSTDWLYGLTESDSESKLNDFSFRDLASVIARLWELGYVKIIPGKDIEETGRKGFYLYFPVSSAEFLDSENIFFYNLAKQARKEMFRVIGHDCDPNVKGPAANLMKYNNQSLGNFLLNDLLPLKVLLDLKEAKEEWIDSNIQKYVNEVSSNKIDYCRNSFKESFCKERDEAEGITYTGDNISLPVNVPLFDLYSIQ